jgi:2-polyprenyl-3-methyl-5-hydroxy-6-metoxy-1,4-benzoquinol methylase
VDINPNEFTADVPFVRLDLNEPAFYRYLGESAFDLVMAVEVIEHLESPVGFLRNIRRILCDDGIAIVTTPNVENVPARVKFMLSGTLRQMDELGDASHIALIFVDLLVRHYLPRASLRLVEHTTYPPDGYLVTRWWLAWVFKVLARMLVGTALMGDTHIFVLKRDI